MENLGSYEDFVIEFGEDNGFDVWPENEPLPEVPFMELDDEALLARITALKVDALLIDQELDQSVEYARIRGVSWERIGDALGISRQAAHARWSGKGKEYSKKQREKNRALSELGAEAARSGYISPRLGRLASEVDVEDNGFDI